jgi:tripartite-type tricarboxylate transporter receptor subunit TctC
MPRLLCILDSLVVGAFLMCGGCAAWAQSYPAKPLRIITADAGGVSDLTARLIGQALAAESAQAVIVDNRAFTGLEMAAKAPPDGYTLLFYSGSLCIGVETAGGTPSEFASIIQAEIIRLGKVIKNAGIRAD